MRKNGVRQYVRSLTKVLSKSYLNVFGTILFFVCTYAIRGRVSKSMKARVHKVTLFPRAENIS